MAQLHSPCTLPLRLAQIAHGGKLELGRRATLQEMQQRRDRGGSEPQQCQRMNEIHVSSRSAMPNGRSV